jgi:hypothetical protein
MNSGGQGRVSSSCSTSSTYRVVVVKKYPSKGTIRMLTTQKRGNREITHTTFRFTCYFIVSYFCLFFSSFCHVWVSWIQLEDRVQSIKHEIDANTSGSQCLTSGFFRSSYCPSFCSLIYFTVDVGEVWRYPEVVNRRTDNTKAKEAQKTKNDLQRKLKIKQQEPHKKGDEFRWSGKSKQFLLH